MLSFILFFSKNTPWTTWLAHSPALQGQLFCTEVLPLSPYRAMYASLICGLPLPPGQEKQWILDTGVIHLIVVSGLHLIFIESLLRFLPRPARLTVLALYSYLTGFQAPVVRALLRRILGPPLKNHMGLTALQAEACGVLLLLCFYPQWLWSRSFLMSWMGGLAMCIPFQWVTYRPVDRALKAYILLLPFCWASPLVFLWNISFVPLVGLILFPLSLLVMLVPPLVPLGDGLWWIFLEVLRLGPQAAPLPIFTPTPYILWLPPLLHLLLLHAEVSWRRAFAFS